jgi:hypothetical protein
MFYTCDYVPVEFPDLIKKCSAPSCDKSIAGTAEGFSTFIYLQ